MRTADAPLSEQSAGEEPSFFAVHRLGVQAGLDAAAWAIGLISATLVRHDFIFSNIDVGGMVAASAAAVVLGFAVGVLFGLYSGRWQFGSFDEVMALVRTVMIVGPATTLLSLSFTRLIPLGASLAGPIIALVLMCGSRWMWRLFTDRRLRPSTEAERLIVFGAGGAGSTIVRSLMRQPAGAYRPVAILDDNPSLRRRRIGGVPVFGDRTAMADVAEALDARTILLALPSAGSATIRELVDLASEAGLTVKVLPGVSELIDGRIDTGDIRSLTEADLLGRRVIDTDIESIASYISGRRVLVTGAGGSIGSELCRQLHGFAPDQLIMLDRDESALHAVQLSIEGKALLETRDLVVADIRDRDRVMAVFEEHRPHVVFHTAALKHLPLLEMHPSEGVKTNVYGTRHLLDAAARYEVDRFINISTDKAADPTSVLGYTKRLAERLTAETASRAPGTYLSVRFGNVLGSRGSVVPAFKQQILDGGPVTVTHPDVTRFFMTIPEAVQLVIQAGAIGSDGEALILDMGEPVKIADLARRLVDASGRRDVEIVFTGLRPGEKMHEDLVGVAENDSRPIHPLITHADVPALHALNIPMSDAEPPAALIERLRELCQNEVEIDLRSHKVA